MLNFSQLGMVSPELAGITVGPQIPVFNRPLGQTMNLALLS